jgi:hypothetical protein
MNSRRGCISSASRLLAGRRKVICRLWLPVRVRIAECRGVVPCSDFRCNPLQTGLPLFGRAHRVVLAGERALEVRRRLRDVRVPQPVADGVQRHAAIEPARARLSPQIVKMQVDGLQLDAAGRRQSACAAVRVFGRVPVRTQHRPFPRPREPLDGLPDLVPERSMKTLLDSRNGFGGLRTNSFLIVASICAAAGQLGSGREAGKTFSIVRRVSGRGGCFGATRDVATALNQTLATLCSVAIH